MIAKTSTEMPKSDAVRTLVVSGVVFVCVTLVMAVVFQWIL